VEESKTRGRPVPCRTCLQYHTEGKCSKTPCCYKCGEAHHSNTCKVIPNKLFCGTCKVNGHCTAASNCPRRPQINQKVIAEKIYRSNPINKDMNYSNILRQNTTDSDNQTNTQKITQILRYQLLKMTKMTKQ